LQPRHDLLDPTRLQMSRLIQYSSVVFLREVRGQHPDSGEVDISRGEAVKDEWKLPRGPGGLDPIVCRVLRQMENLGAVGKQRGEAFSQVEPPFIEDCEMRDEDGCGRSLLMRENFDPGNQLLIGQPCGR
jgi:hypothetical protein